MKISNVSHRAHKEHKGLKMNENELSEIIIECAIKVNKTLEPGLLESVYEKILTYELKKKSNKWNYFIKPLSSPSGILGAGL